MPPADAKFAKALMLGISTLSTMNRFSSGLPPRTMSNCGPAGAAAEPNRSGSRVSARVGQTCFEPAALHVGGRQVSDLHLLSLPSYQGVGPWSLGCVRATVGFSTGARFRIGTRGKRRAPEQGLCRGRLAEVRPTDSSCARPSPGWLCGGRLRAGTFARRVRQNSQPKCGHADANRSRLSCALSGGDLRAAHTYRHLASGTPVAVVCGILPRVRETTNLNWVVCEGTGSIPRTHGMRRRR